MPVSKVKEFLDSKEVEYTTLKHEAVFTAQEVAAAAHIPGRELAKSVMVKVDGEMAMAVLPASYRVNFDQLKKSIGAKKVVLVPEAEFKDHFPDCEVGAVPPFGNLYGMQVYVDESLSEQMVIAFCAGTHTELIRLSFLAFQKVVEPTILSFAYKE